MAKKKLFNTKYDDIVILPTEPGCPVIDNFRYEYDRDTGVKTLVRDGSTNVYNYIQAHCDSADINNIVARYNNGDNNALNEVNGFYMDVKDIPDNIADLKNYILRTDELFNKLPVEIKEKFGFSSVKFWSDYGTDEFKEKINNYYGGDDVVSTNDTAGTDTE